MTPDPTLSRWAAQTIRAHPSFGPIERVTEHRDGQAIDWPPSWVAKLNETMKEAAE